MTINHINPDKDFSPLLLLVLLLLFYFFSNFFRQNYSHANVVSLNTLQCDFWQFLFYKNYKKKPQNKYAMFQSQWKFENKISTFHKFFFLLRHVFFCFSSLVVMFSISFVFMVMNDGVFQFDFNFFFRFYFKMIFSLRY